MGKVLLTNDIKEDKTAGLKARVDVLNALKSEGYETLYFPRFKSLSVVRKFWRSLANSVGKDGHIVIEYPVWARRRLYLIRLFARLHRIQFYGIIHDITSIRFQISPKKDIVSLRSFDGLVSHNATLTRWLRDNGYRGKIVDLEVFDYLLPQASAYVDTRLEQPFRLLYAGNLSYAKAKYIYSPDLAGFRNFQLDVYGQYLEEDKFPNNGVVYKGAFTPDTPAFDCAYQFGLIWEGTSLDTCDGEFGNYIRYNDPHKFSLYLSQGLPVIVWKEAAIAPFVLEHNIGFVIGSLQELDAKLGELSAGQYGVYVENVRKMTPKIRSGYFLKTAMQKLVKS